MNQPKRSRCEIARKVTSPTATPTSKQFKGRKRWQIAQARSKDGRQQKDNASLEISYFNALNAAKRLMSGSKKLAFERDYRGDKSTYLFMYGFVTDCCYLLLECELDNCYSLEFAFYKCKYEPQLRELLTPLKDHLRIKEVSLQPDFASYYKNVLAFQPTQYHHFL